MKNHLAIFTALSLLVASYPANAQTVTNAQSEASTNHVDTPPGNTSTPEPTSKPNSVYQKLTPDQIQSLMAQGVNPKDIPAYAAIKILTPEEIQQIQQQQQAKMRPTPPDLKNAFVYVDDFMGTGKTGIVADVISIKHDGIKYRINGHDFDYSGDFSVILTTPRKHTNQYFGLGSPETAKLLTLQDFFKDQADATMILQNATIWEKSDGFIDAVAMDKEWIHKGNYTIQKVNE